MAKQARVTDGSISFPFYSSDQLAGFNPMALNSVEQQPTPMFSEEGRGSEAPGPLAIGPQREMASFFSQLPTEGGLVETNNVS